MWIRTVNGLYFIEVEQTVQGFIIPKNLNISYHVET